jgi:hypothetical protein
MSSYSSLPGCRTSSRSKKPSNYAKYIEEYQKQVNIYINQFIYFRSFQNQSKNLELNYNHQARINNNKYNCKENKLRIL